MELKSPIPPAVDDRSIVIDGRELEHQGGVDTKLDRDLPNLVITPVGVMESVQDTWNHGLSYAQQALSTTPCGPCYQLVPCEEAEADGSFVFSLFQWDLTHHYKKVPFQTREQVEESLALMTEEEKLALAKRYGCRPNQLASYIPSNGRGRRPVLRELHFLTYSPLDDCEPEYLDSVYSAFLAALAGTATEKQKALFRECRDGLVDSGLSVSDAIELFREIPRLAATIRASQEVLGVRFGRDEYDEQSDALEGFVEKPLEAVDVTDDEEGEQVITEKMVTGIPPHLKKHLKSNATWWKFVNQGANLVAEDEDALKKGIFGVVNIKFLNAYAQADGVGQFFAPFISGPEWKIPTFRQIKAALERLVQASEQAHAALLQDSEWSHRSISMTALYNEGQVDSEEVEEVEVFDDDLDEDGNPYPLNFEPDEAELPDMYFDEAEQMTSVRPRPGLGSRVPDSPQMLPQEELLAREIARKAAPRDILVPRSTFGPFAQELPWEQDQVGFFKGHPLARQIQKFIDGVNSPRSYASIGVNDPSLASYVGVVRVPRNIEIFTEAAPVPPCEFWSAEPRSSEPRLVEFFYVNIVYASGTLEEVLAPLGFFNDFPTEVEIYIGKHAAAPTSPQSTVLANDVPRDVWVKDAGGMRFWRNVHFPKRSVFKADKMYIIERMYSDEDTQTFRCSKFYNDDNSVSVHAFRVNQKGSDATVWQDMIPAIQEDGSFQTQPFLGVNQRESNAVKFPISIETFEKMTAWYAEHDLPCPYLMPMPSLNGAITLYDAIFTCRAEIDMWTLLSKPVLMFVEAKIEKVQAHQAFPTLILAVGELLQAYMDPRNPLDDADLFDHIQEIQNGLMDFQRRAVYHSMFNLNEGSIQPFSMRLRELMMGDSSFQRSKEFGNGKTAYQELVSLKDDSVLRGILNAIGGAIYNSGASVRDFFLALGYAHHEFGPEEMAEKCIAHLKDQTFRQYQPWGTKKQGTYSLGVLGDVVAYYTAWLYLSDVSRAHLELLVDVTGGENGFAWDLPLAFKVSAKLNHGPILGGLIARSFHRKVMQGSGSGWEIPDVLQERLPPLLLAHGKDVDQWPSEQVYRRSVEEAEAINQGLIEARRVLEKRIRRAVYERGLGFAGRQMLGAILDVPPQNLNKEFLREKLERDRDLGVLSVGEFRLLKVYAE